LTQAHSPQTSSPGQRGERSSFRAALVAAWAALRAIGWRLTPEGQLWLLTVVLLLGVGIVKNINLLTLLGYVMLAVLLLNALFVGRRLRLLEARRQVEEPVFARGSCAVEVRLRNLSKRPRPGVFLEDAGPLTAAGEKVPQEPDLPAGKLDWYLDRLEGNARGTCRGTFVLPARGWYDWGPVVAVSGYPFGLVRRRVAVSAPSRVLALPRPGKLSREALRQFLRGADPRGERVHRRGWHHQAAQADFHGLRPFRPGDSPRMIHWRTSARRGELTVREMEDVPGEDLVLVLDTETTPGDLFEEAVTLAATIVWEWCQRRGDRLVLAVGPAGALLDGRTGPEHAWRLLECLAAVQPRSAAAPAGAEEGPPGGVLDAICQIAPPLSVFVISAGPSDLGDALEAEIGPSVTLLDVAHRDEWSFYSRG
jgi:uncharacterized protein (DUF58 family)